MTDYVHDQGDLEDKIVLLHEQFDKAHEKKEKQLNRLKVAQEKYHASQQIVDFLNKKIHLSFKRKTSFVFRINFTLHLHMKIFS